MHSACTLSTAGYAHTHALQRPLMQSLIQSSTRIHNVWNSSTTNTWTEAC